MNILILLANFLFFLFLLPLPVSAQQIILGDNQQYGIPAFRNPNNTVGNFVASGLQIAVIFALLAVLIFIVWGAFDWVTSGGDKEKISGARKKITNAIIGLVLIALAGFIVTLVGQIVGINPLSMGLIPQLGVPASPAPGTPP